MAASIEFQGTDTDSGASSSYTLSFTVASAAGQERLVALASINDHISAVAISSVTVDGQTATQVGSYAREDDGSGVGALVSFWRAAGTASTNINVAFTLNHGAFSAYGAVWSLNNANTLLASVTSNDNDPTLDLNTATGGAVAAAGLGFNGSNPAATWTGLTESFDSVTVFGSEGWTGADLDIVSGSTPLAVSIDWPTFGSGAQSAAAVSFNPTVATIEAGVSATLGALTSAASGALRIAGQLSKTLAALTLTASNNTMVPSSIFEARTRRRIRELKNVRRPRL